MKMYNKIKNYLPIIVFLAGMLPILHNLGTMGLLEPTESLIGSIARYMVDTNNLSTPIANEIKHFELPPGVYWITAFGIKLFGTNEFGARFFLSIASGLTAVCIFFIAKLFFGTQCAIISCLLLCTSALFQISFRILSPTVYCTAFESILCLIFFYYLSKPIKSLKLIFWLSLSIAFLFSGFGVLLPIIALIFAALYSGQNKAIKSLFSFIPGILSFIVFGLGWYIIQMIINPGLFSYFMYKYPLDSFINNYNGIPFYIYIFLPLISIFPWSIILLQQLYTKIKEFKSDPAVTYLVCWAFIPFIVRLFMVSREYTQFISSLPPLILLTAPAFQSIYFKKDTKSGDSLINVSLRRKHNLYLIIFTAIIGIIFTTFGIINWSDARVVSQTLVFTGTFWLFSCLIMTAFMIKRLNKSVLVPAALLIQSLILFTVPAIQGNEPISSEIFLPSKAKLLSKIRLVTNCDYICYGKQLYSYYFYTGKSIKLLSINDDYSFITEKAKNLIFDKAEKLGSITNNDYYFVLPSNEKENLSRAFNKSFNINTEDGDWIIATMGGNLK